MEPSFKSSPSTLSQAFTAFMVSFSLAASALQLFRSSAALARLSRRKASLASSVFVE
jgi:hypothetical protein